MRRSDTGTETASRSARMFKEDNAWFFNTREGKAIGPFRDKLEASTQLEVYIRMAGCGLLSSRASGF